MNDSIVLKSNLDRSINLIQSVPDGGYFESRFVQRLDDTIIIYLSSTSGCNQACRFCHLTQTGQTTMTPVTIQDYELQAAKTLEKALIEYDLSEVKIVHYNFMSRGDVFSNPEFIKNWADIFTRLQAVAQRCLPGVEAKMKLSTIFPMDIPLPLNRIKPDLIDKILQWGEDHDMDIEIYYSLYSLNPQFRKRWIPKGFNPELVGSWFKGRIQGLRLHHALIAGENDSVDDLNLIIHWLFQHDLKVKINIVRYNPFDARCGDESSGSKFSTYVTLLEYEPRVELVQIIPKVGEDVKASCGMFYSP